MTGRPTRPPRKPCATGESRLRDLQANWERYLHDNTSLDPLICMAVGHYQFEAIHPFTDGNGRTGRVLNLLFLVERGLLTLPVLYLSRAIIRTKSDYYRLLHSVTIEGRWEDWIRYLVSATEETARWTTSRIRRIRDLMDTTTGHVRAQAPKLYSRELVELIFSQPYCRIGNVVEAGIAKRQTSSEYLKKLCAISVLEEVKVGREKVFINPRLIRLLTSDDEAPRH